MAEKQFKKQEIETQVAGKVMLAFLSIAPQLLIVSLVSYAAAIMGLNYFFEPTITASRVGAVITGVSLGLGLLTIFLSIYLFIERKLFEILYSEPKSEQVFDNAVQYFWKGYKKSKPLEKRWEGTRKIYFKAIMLCTVQCILTLLGFALMVAGIK